MKRTTSKYSIRQVFFTNICFVVVSKGPPHLTLKPSIFQLVSVFFVLGEGALLLLAWFGSLFVSFVLDYELPVFPYRMGIFPYFLVSPCVPDHRFFFLALLLKLLFLCRSCSCVASFSSFLHSFLPSLLSILLSFLVSRLLYDINCFFISCLMRRTRKTRMLECFPSIIKPVCLSCLSFCFLVNE